ncbi:MAG TPA: helix-turn-helix domain-containing protein [Thermoanaerobaculia bacterium]|nr:helix-turn-helix domain-containing protein [Thermoanaerobaculia bacterium]
MRKRHRSLLHRGSRNPKPERVQDPLFSEDPFFDPEDLVQVKYEMLRRARVDGASVSAAAALYGLSRPAFYEAHRRFETHGLPGLLSKRPGPKEGHKLSEEVVDFVAAIVEQEPQTSTAELVQRLEERFALRVHPRSIERALARRRKKNLARAEP